MLCGVFGCWCIFFCIRDELEGFFWAVCNLYLAGKFTELRITVGYMRAGKVVVLYNLSLLSCLRPDKFFSFERCCSANAFFYGLSTVIG